MDVNVYLKHPFYLDTNLTVEKIQLHLEHDESKTITVQFDPSSPEKKCFTVDGELTFDYCDHPHLVIILLYFVVLMF